MRSRIATNMIWRFAERCGAQAVTLVVSIILGRILSPETYGTVAIVTAITTILQVFVDSGLGTALIQKKDADDVDFSSVFYFNIVFCVAVYALLFAIAPWIAAFFENEELTALTRGAGVIVLISSIKSIQVSYVSRTLQFRKFFFSTIGGTLCSGVVGLWMAFKGYGAWALVAQSITNQVIGTIILWLTIRWRPKRVFSFERLKNLFSYGWKILVTRLLDHGYNELRQFVIGKFYSSADLAFFNRGKQFPDAIIHNVESSIDSVMFPVLSQVQDNKARMKQNARRSIKLISFIIAPMAIGMMAVAEPMIRLLLTDTWLPCVPYLRVFCLVSLIDPLNVMNLNVIKASGDSALLLKCKSIGRVVSFAVLFVSVMISSYAVALSGVINGVLLYLIYSHANGRKINYKLTEQLKDVIGIWLLAFAMGGIVLLIEYIPLPTLCILLLQVLVGVATYVLGAKLLKLDSLDMLLRMLKNRKQSATKEAA